jgi:hypothetical protein
MQHCSLFVPGAMSVDSILREPGTWSFAPKWTNAKAARVAYLATLGRSSVAIAEALGDGTDGGTIRCMLNTWGIALPDGEIRSLIQLTNRERYALKWRAEREGLEPEEWLRRKAVEAIKAGLAGV